MAYGSTPSFLASLLVPKVSNDPGNMVQYMRTFQQPVDVNFVNVDSYGRGPISVYSGNYPQLSNKLGDYSARYSPLYRIDVENAQRPQYATYLNVPQGLMTMQSNYMNRPSTDLLVGSKSAGRAGSFSMDGTYMYPSPPVNNVNPASERDWMMSQDWLQARAVTHNDNRSWVSGAAVQQAGGKVSMASGF